MTSSETFVITGIGVLTPIGVGRGDFEKNLFDGVAPTPSGEVQLKSELYLDRRTAKSMSRSSLLACVGTALALQDSDLQLDKLDKSRIAITFGTLFGSLASVFDFDAEAVAEGKRYVDAMKFPNTVMNAPAGYAAALWGFTGPNVTVSNGLSSGLEAVRYGCQLLCNHQADMVLAGGYEQLSPLTRNAFKSSRIGQAQNGFFPSEGAAVFVIERLEAALRRGASILAWISGIGTSMHGVELNRIQKIDAVVNAMTRAIQQAQLTPTALGGIVASANGLVQEDQIELEAIHKIAGDGVPIITPKALLGESGGAGGAIGLACAVGSLVHQRIPAAVELAPVRGMAQTASREAPDKPACSSILVNAIEMSLKTISVVVSPAEFP